MLLSRVGLGPRVCAHGSTGCSGRITKRAANVLGSVEVVPGDAVIKTCVCVLLCFGLGFAFFFFFQALQRKSVHPVCELVLSDTEHCSMGV